MTFVSVPENDFSKPFSLQEREQRNKIKDGPLLQEVTCIQKHLLVKKDYEIGRVSSVCSLSARFALIFAVRQAEDESTTFISN